MSGLERKNMDNQGTKYWRSLNVLNNSGSQDIQDAKTMEFPEGQDQELNIDKMDPFSRRKFLALMTASGVFATTACTDYRDKGELINYTKKPEEIQPGIANYYASTITTRGRSWGVLIKTREGRPIRVDGNPDHPINQGKIDVTAQASVVDLYDPDRIKAPTRAKRSDMHLDQGKMEDLSWEKADKEIIEILEKANAAGQEIVVYAGSQTSPSAVKLLNAFKAKYPTTNIYTNNLFNDSNRNSAWMKSYGESQYPGVKLDKADIILSIDCDFLGTDGDQIENTRMYTSRRDINDAKNFNRMYSVEAGFTTTGGLADYRMRLRPEAQYEFVMSLASEMAKHMSGFDASAAGLGKYNLDGFIKANGLVAKKVNKLVDDLVHSKGKAIVMAGRQMPENVHVAVNLLNEVIGATALYKTKNVPVNLMAQSSSDDLKSMVADMSSGKVGVFINMGANPVNHLPNSYGFESALEKVGNVISLSYLEDETAMKADYKLPINHDFESWGDHLSRSGVISLQQPVINPIYNTREKEASIYSWMNGGNVEFNSYHKFIMDRWRSEVHASLAPMSPFKEFWNNSLHDGVVSLKEAGRTNSQFNFAALSSANSLDSKLGYTVILTENPNIHDGSYANNGFLQETPHPVTKVTWDNYAMMSVATANEVDVKMNDLVTVAIGDRSVTLPALVQPGMADNVITIDLGFGRMNAGQIGSEVGFDANALMANAGDYIITAAAITKAEGTHKLASTQEHHMLDEKFDSDLGNAVAEAATSDGEGYTVADFHKVREIIQEGTVEDYLHDPSHIVHRHKGLKSIMKNHEYEGVKWAMAIDLNKCTGCNACVTSCNVESNVPVVGRNEVLVGREMQWMRLDRYYSGTNEEPRMSIQPMLCQHCDNAPCENVCPVVATTHSPDGLNQMVYNRCVGTRYCANNCPYKVRRFNFFDFRRNLAEGFYYSLSMQQMYNPEVTVRSRGVMEKCDFCTSRIADASSRATKEGRELKGSDVTTACQEACPANAIYFGDMNDPESEVSKLREHDLGYHVLEVLDVKPNVTYVAKLINTESETKDHSEGSNGH